MTRILAFVVALLAMPAALAQSNFPGTTFNTNLATVAPNVPAGDSSYKVANTAFVQGAIGLFTINCPASNWVRQISSASSVCSQPAFTDISGSLASSQLPSPLTNATRQGNTSAFVTFAGSAPSSGHLVTWDVNGNIQDGGAGGNVTNVTCNGLAITTSGTCPPSFGFQNCSITASVASNNLTVALKDNAGSDPSASSPCNVWFRNSTLATGSWTQVTQTAALSFTANSGSTFGVTNTAATCVAASSCPFRLWVVGFNTGSGLALGVVALTNASGVQPLNEGILLSSTTCSACVNATALGTIYSTAGQASKPVVLLGYLEWGSGLATAGTYASAPTAIQTIGPGIKRPGELVQTQVFQSTGVTTVGPTGTSFGTGTNTNVAATIVPTSSANIIRTYFNITGTNSTAGTSNFCQLARSGPTAAGISFKQFLPASFIGNIGGTSFDTPGSTSSQTYTVRCWVGAGTGTVPDTNTTPVIEILDEIMGANDNEKVGLPALPKAA